MLARELVWALAQGWELVREHLARVLAMAWAQNWVQGLRWLGGGAGDSWWTGGSANLDAKIVGAGRVFPRPAQRWAAMAHRQLLHRCSHV